MKQNSEEQRVFARNPCGFSVDVKDLYDHSLEKTRGFDFSTTGLGVLSKRSFGVDKDVELRIRFSKKHPPLKSSAKVRWIRQEASGRWRVGFEFFPVNLVKFTPLMAYS